MPNSTNSAMEARRDDESSWGWNFFRKFLPFPGINAPEEQLHGLADKAPPCGTQSSSNDSDSEQNPPDATYEFVEVETASERSSGQELGDRE